MGLWLVEGANIVSNRNAEMKWVVFEIGRLGTESYVIVAYYANICTA